MIVGDPLVFAIESGITRAYERLSFLALGFFVVHLHGRRYGVHAPDATLLACSLDEVERRLAHRGRHTARFAAESDAVAIADAFLGGIYADEKQETYFGMPLAEFSEVFAKRGHNCTWAPDGDEAFDDGSYVLQFDVEDRVRLIAFKSGEGFRHVPGTLNDLSLSAGSFYEILQGWRDSFLREWKSLPKLAG